MNLFQSEIIAFIKSIDSNVLLEKWGVLLRERKIGFVFHEITANQEIGVAPPEKLHIVHLWEDLWIGKNEIVKSRIVSLLGTSKRVFARTTKVVKLNKIELLDFLTKNHINKPANTKHKYGLVLGDELLAVAAFSASCPIHRQEEVYLSHQLVRFCTKNGITVVGGLSKLIAHFLKMHSTDDIMSYADLDWSMGKGYLGLGFEEIGKLAPQNFYINPKTLQRYYKLDDANDKSNLLEYTNQGSIKYLLDLKKKGNE